MVIAFISGTVINVNLIMEMSNNDFGRHSLVTAGISMLVT